MLLCLNLSVSRGDMRIPISSLAPILVAVAGLWLAVGCNQRVAASLPKPPAASAGSGLGSTNDPKPEEPKTGVLSAEFLALAPGNCVLITTPSG